MSKHSVCAPPPIQSAEQAICRARLAIAKHRHFNWESSFTAERKAKEWLVRYQPTSSGVRGGAGTIKVGILTGVVSFTDGER